MNIESVATTIVDGIKNFPMFLALDVAGNPNRWVNFEDASYYYAKGLVAWESGTTKYRLHGGTQRATGNRSILLLSTIIAVQSQTGHFVNHSNMTPPLTNRALFRRDSYICAYCTNVHAGASLLTRDHIIPRVQGGRDVWNNVVTSCSHCNKRKGGRTPEQAGMQLRYVPYTPNRYEWLILLNRKILDDQMEYLIRNVGKNSRLLALVA